MRIPRGSYSFDEYIEKTLKYLPPPTPSELRAMRQTTMSKKVNVTTDEFEAKFVNLTEHESFDGKTTGKFSITMAFKEESEGAKKIATAVAEADDFKGEGHSPIKEREGNVEVKGKSKFEVRCVDADNNSIPADQIDFGDICRAEIAFQAYQTGTSKGVTCYLQSVQKLRNREFGTSTDNPPPKDDNYLPKDYGKPALEGDNVLTDI